MTIALVAKRPLRQRNALVIRAVLQIRPPPLQPTPPREPQPPPPPAPTIAAPAFARSPTIPTPPRAPLTCRQRHRFNRRHAAVSRLRSFDAAGCGIICILPTVSSHKPSRLGLIHTRSPSQSRPRAPRGRLRATWSLSTGGSAPHGDHDQRFSKTSAKSSAICGYHHYSTCGGPAAQLLTGNGPPSSPWSPHLAPTTQCDHALVAAHPSGSRRRSSGPGWTQT